MFCDVRSFMLIPTSVKEKLPKTNSYPVGAEVISESLAGVPQYQALELKFHYRDVWWASEYNQRVKSLGEIVVVDIRSYTVSSETLTLGINSVPSHLKSDVAEKLKK